MVICHNIIQVVVVEHWCSGFCFVPEVLEVLEVPRADGISS